MICQTASRRLNHIMDQVIFLHQIASLATGDGLLSVRRTSGRKATILTKTTKTYLTGLTGYSSPGWEKGVEDSRVQGFKCLSLGHYVGIFNKLSHPEFFTFPINHF